MAKHNVWMSVSDMMTGLMVIFLFVAVAYMIQVEKNQSVLSEYVENRKNLHDELVKEFAGDTARWVASMGTDLSMKFKNPEVLFASGSFEITDSFKRILDDFIPRYLGILLSGKFKDRIKEIRIEGHTDDEPAPRYHPNPFIANTMLSQLRAVSVLHYLRSMPSYQAYKDEEKEMLEYLFTANGLSYGKAVDDNDEYVYISKKSINRAKSRRVEFRVITTGEEAIDEFLKIKDNAK